MEGRSISTKTSPRQVLIAASIRRPGDGVQVNPSPVGMGVGNGGGQQVIADGEAGTAQQGPRGIDVIRRQEEIQVFVRASLVPEKCVYAPASVDLNADVATFKQLEDLQHSLRGHHGPQSFTATERSVDTLSSPASVALNPAGVTVERVQVRLVVDVEPLAAGRPHLLDKRLHELFAHSSPLIAGVDDGVEKERVQAPVPASVDEADERVLVEGPNPAEAVSTQPLGPGQDLTRRVPESNRMEPRQADVIDRKADVNSNGGGHRSRLGSSCSRVHRIRRAAPAVRTSVEPGIGLGHPGPVRRRADSGGQRDEQLQLTMTEC